MRVNIYIRKDNEDAWAAIKDKSEWINDILMDPAAPQAERKVTTMPTTSSLGLGMACCVLRSPCKHWAFDSVACNWKNILTGEVRNAD